MKTQVVIIGAGPTGLMAANQLTRFGIDFIIVDTKGGPTEQSRAIAITSRSMEIYQQLGLSDKILEDGARINSFNVYSRGKRKAEVKIGQIGKGISEFHYLFAFEQSKNEELLYENLKQNGKEVLWETGFKELKEVENGLEVFIENSSGKFTIQSEYLIACDGAKSPVRHQLGFKFNGGTYENKFFVADVILNWNIEYDKLVLFPSDKNFCGFFPMNGDRCYRIIGTLPLSYRDSEKIAFKDIEEVVVKTAGTEMSFEKVNWFSIYNLHHRCVDTFSKGRVFLAGDSAHIHSPAGGQGMNTGLQDAYNIAWKLSFVLKNQAKPSLLNTYNEERLPFAQWLMSFTDRGFRVMTSANWFVAWFRRNVMLNLIGKIITLKKLRPRIFNTVSQLWYSYNGKTLAASSTKQNLLFKAGDRLPYMLEKTGESFYSRFRESSFHLIHIGNTPLNEQTNTGIKTMFPFPIKMVECEATENWTKLGVKNELFILVRPDNYIGFISDKLIPDEIGAYLKPYFN